jgi:hypothetical protein
MMVDEREEQTMRHHLKEWRSTSIVHDLQRRQLLCEMIAVSRERWLMEMRMDGYPVVYSPSQWTVAVDQRCGSKYSFILVGGVRKFAVEHATAAIFAVAQTMSGRVERERRYGTLDTLEEWKWEFIEPKLRFLDEGRA